MLSASVVTGPGHETGRILHGIARCPHDEVGVVLPLASASADFRDVGLGELGTMPWQAPY